MATKKVKREKSVNPLYRPPAPRASSAPYEVVRWVVDIACNESNEVILEYLCVEAAQKFDLAFSGKSLLSFIRRSDYYKERAAKIKANQLRLHQMRDAHFCNSDVTIFWPTWKLIEKGYLVEG